MGNSHCLRFFIATASAVCSIAQTGAGETIFVDHSLQKTRLLRNELIVSADFFSRTFSLVLHVVELILPGRVQHCFFFLF